MVQKGKSRDDDWEELDISGGSLAGWPARKRSSRTGQKETPIWLKGLLLAYCCCWRSCSLVG